MDEQITNLALASINERLSHDPTNRALILEKLIFLRNFSHKDDDEFKDEFKKLLKSIRPTRITNINNGNINNTIYKYNDKCYRIEKK